MGAFGPGDLAKNLGLAVAGETYEIDEMYPSFMEVAKLQGEKGAYRSFNCSYQTEMMHKALFEKAKEAADQGSDVALVAVQVCQVCGYTVEGEAPEKCPVCDAPREKFTAFGR